MLMATTKKFTITLPSEDQMSIYRTVLRMLIPILLTATALAGEQQQVYDGTWWHATKKEQHSGWLAGYIDCSVIHGKTELGFISWDTLATEVTKVYASNSAEIKRPVSAVAYNVVTKLPKPQKGTKTEVHSGFDGDYWRQVEPEHREGYVQGFLTCYRELKTSKASFSKPAPWYASEISKWFGIKADDPGEINPKRENEFISNVLFLFKDSPVGRKKLIGKHK